ncbi:MAG: hypothetical protein QXL09_01695 [Candidatus Aenigmatarchaeota archaeon]
MYSKKILRILKMKKIDVGNLVEIISENRRIRGILMPKPETSDPNCLIIKLDDGYNIGVRINSSKDIIKVGEN